MASRRPLLVWGRVLLSALVVLGLGPLVLEPCGNGHMNTSYDRLPPPSISGGEGVADTAPCRISRAHQLKAERLV